MRKLILLLFLMAAILPANATQFGVGVCGGVNIPVIQQDQGSGTIFGLKAKFNLLPGVSVEPNLNFAKFGDAKKDFGTRKGSQITSYGVDAILGAGLPGVGVKMYGLVGGGVYSTKKRDIDPATTKMGWAAGLGVEIGFTSKIAVDIRGKLNVISSEGGGSKKSAALTGGINYYFGF